MNILFLALAYPNADITTNLYTDLMEEFHRNKHNVFVVAPSKNNTTKISVEGNINVLRVKTGKLFNTNIIRKGLANVLLPYQYKKAIKKHSNISSFDLIIMPTPPITLLTVLAYFQKTHKAKSYLILRDIFPQNAVDLKMMSKGGIIHRYFRAKENKLYKTVDTIGCMSLGNLNYLLKHNPEVKASKLHILPNWEKLSLKPEPSLDELNEVKKKYKIEDKFIVIFGGNIGAPQKLENIINLAISCQDIKDIVFLIIGEGSKKNSIINKIKELNCKNILIKNSVDKSEYFKILRASQVGLISLSESFTIPNIPSKSLSYFNAKKPILAAIDLNTDFGEIIEEKKAGLWAKADDVEELKKKLIQFYDNPELMKEMGLNGYNYLQNELTPKQAYNTILKNV